MDISTSSAYAEVDPGQTPHMLAYVAKGSPIGITADTHKRAADLATIRFRHGATGLLHLLEAQRAQLKGEDVYAECHSDGVLSGVLFYKSLAVDGLLSLKEAGPLEVR